MKRNMSYVKIAVEPQLGNIKISDLNLSISGYVAVDEINSV